jgi:NADH-quinone oxidoreductase subunit D
MSPVSHDFSLGPLDPLLPGPLKVQAKVCGAFIEALSLEPGYTHRGLEKCFEGHHWKTGIHYAGHLDPEAGFFGEYVYAKAVEQLFQLEVPLRAVRIRVLLLEMSRIVSHLRYLVNLARILEAKSIEHYVLRDREKFLDLFELYAGLRHSFHACRFGGVAFDVTDGFLERVLEACERLKSRIWEYQWMLVSHSFFMSRAKGVGLLSREHVLKWGLTGPDARLVLRDYDLRHRKDASYKDVPICVDASLLAESSDTFTRVQARLTEIEQTVDCVAWLVESLPEGPIAIPIQKKMEQRVRGQGYAEVESPRGVLGCFVHSDGSLFPSRVQFRVPSSALITMIPHWAQGQSLEDFPLNLASLDLSTSEVDR